MAACRAAKTSEQKEARREEARTRHATARAAETPEQRQARRGDDRARKQHRKGTLLHQISLTRKESQ